MIQIVLIVAVADNGVIGSAGALPWRLKSDLQRFKQLTLNKPVVMGRKTFASIGRPLPGRTNIVMTRDTGLTLPGAVVTSSFDTAQAIARGDALRRFATEIAVIGGAEVYAQWLAVADRIELTEVHASPAGDAHFAALDAAAWEEAGRIRNAAAADDSADFSM